MTRPIEIPNTYVSTPGRPRSVQLRDLTWEEIQPFANDQTVVILPVAAIEQHGRHLPIEVDTRLVESVSILGAKAASETTTVLVAPAVHFGVSGYHMRYPGTLTLTMNTFITVVEEICLGLIHHGFRRILILNGHGGNHDPIKVAARNVADKSGVAVVAASYWNLAADDLSEFQDTEVTAIPGHACGFETAMMRAIRPESVLLDSMKSDNRDATNKGGYFVKRLRREPLAHLPQQAGVVSEDGWAADPTIGTPEKGEKYLGLIVDRLADFLTLLGSTGPFVAEEPYLPGEGLRQG